MPAAAPVDQDRRRGGPDEERQQRTEAGHDDADVAKREVVGHRRHDAGHVGRVLPDSEESPGVGRARDERQRSAETAIRGVAAFGGSECAEIIDGHGYPQKRGVSGQRLTPTC
ncbi:hypothetical protein IST495A_05962 [Burkholderia multivorans]|nr:hypothetical protein IST495A_05962 [Burkholderia multivorans]